MFAYTPLNYSVDGEKLNLLGEYMKLDLSSIVAAHNNVAAIDLTGTGANTLMLNLSDLLSLPATNGMHKLTLTGDANDAVDLDLSEWTDTGTTVTENGHSYTVYNGATDTSAQLLIDQQMLQSHQTS